MKELFLEMKRVLKDIDADPDNPGVKLFKTVKLDKGQFDRAIHDMHNEEISILYPAIFIRFVNVAYLVRQNRVGEGNGTMRVRFILNRLNDQEDEFETEIFDYAGIINAAIQDSKTDNDNIDSKLSLSYFDMPETSNQLQACWMDYLVKFTDSSGDKYREYIDKQITVPSLTNRSDILEETRPDIELTQEEADNQPKIEELVS